MQCLSLGASKTGPPLISLAGLWAPGVRWPHAPARPLFCEHLSPASISDALFWMLVQVLSGTFEPPFWGSCSLYILNCGLVSFSVRSIPTIRHLTEILPTDSTQIACFLTFTFISHFSFIITKAMLWLLQWKFGNGTVTP